MGAKRKILIVDDDPKLRKTFFDILKDEDYAPITVSTGKEALSKIKEEAPAVALIDLRLEDISGLKVMKGIKEYCSDIQCIVLTGYASQSSAIEAVNLGAYSYLQKPYDMEQLLVTIRRAIEKLEAEEALRASEGKYRFLFNNMLEGFAYCKIIVDKNNKPVDFEYIEVNDAFEALTGLKKEHVTGKRATKAIPGIKKAHPELFKIYGKVALTGKATNFEIYFEPLKIWLSISIYCPKRGYFVAVFDNITERKWVEKEAQRREDQNALIYKVGQRVSSELELEAALSEIVSAVRDAFDYHNVMLDMVDKEAGHMVVQSIAGAYVDFFPKDKLMIPLGEGMTGYAAATGKTQVSGDVSQDPHYICDMEETKSELAVPIKRGKKVVGVLDIQSDKLEAFDEIDINTMETLSTQIAAAIENARLYKQAQRDITERKKAEEELEDIFNLSPDMIAVCTTEGKFLKVNPSWEKVLGYTTKEILDLGWAKLVHPDDVARTNKEVEKQLKGGPVVNFSNRFKCKDGSYKSLEWQATYAKEGIVHATARDITERKKAEEELREKEEFNFALFQHNPIQIIVVDREGRVIKINMAKRKSGDRMPNIGDVMYKDYARSHEIDMHSELMECMRQDKTKMFPELKYDDKFLNISIASFPKGAIITSQDITEQKRAEKERERLQAQLIQSEKMAGIGTLASGIAHEFNNLLHIMRGHAEFAQSTKKAKDMEEALDMVLKTSDDVAKIVGDLLTFARKKPSEEEKESGDIADSIELVLSLTEEHLRKQNIKVIRKYGRTPQIEMNRGEIQQVFLNIVNNARDAMLPKGGKLEIETKQHNGNIEVSISDTGKGIEKENLGKLFEPFFTTKRTEEDDSDIPGTGLGLSVSYGIVKRHGGTIEVKSKINKGTTFTLKLPLKEKRRKSQDKNK